MSRERRTAFSPLFGMPYGEPTKEQQAKYIIGEILSDQFPIICSDSVHEEFLAILEQI